MDEWRGRKRGDWKCEAEYVENASGQHELSEYSDKCKNSPYFMNNKNNLWTVQKYKGNVVKMLYV